MDPYPGYNNNNNNNNNTTPICKYDLTISINIQTVHMVMMMIVIIIMMMMTMMMMTMVIAMVVKFADSCKQTWQRMSNQIESDLRQKVVEPEWLLVAVVYKFLGNTPSP